MNVKEKFLVFWKWKFRNYAIALLMFLLWIVFFAPNNLFKQIQATRELRSLRKMKTFYEKEIENYQRLLQELNSNPSYIEKFARENYLMKKNNEDIFLFIADKDKTQTLENNFNKD